MCASNWPSSYLIWVERCAFKGSSILDPCLQIWILILSSWAVVEEINYNLGKMREGPELEFEDSKGMKVPDSLNLPCLYSLYRLHLCNGYTQASPRSCYALQQSGTCPIRSLLLHQTHSLLKFKFGRWIFESFRGIYERAYSTRLN